MPTTATTEAPFAHFKQATLPVYSMPFKQTIKKLFAFGSKPNATTFPELVNVVIWMRCIIAIGYGIYVSRGTLGGIGALTGLNVIAFIPIMYTILLGADMDSYDNLIFAGVPNALALMLLVWIYCYTLDNASEEEALAAMINVMRTAATEGQEADGEVVTENVEQEVPKVEADSEF